MMLTNIKKPKFFLYFVEKFFLSEIIHDKTQKPCGTMSNKFHPFITYFKIIVMFVHETPWIKYFLGPIGD